MARHTRRSAKVIEEILRRISEGEPLRVICREDWAPAFRTFYDWMEADTDLAARFARAREEGADAIAESILDIADDGTNDWMEKLGEDGQPLGWQLNGEHVQRSKLRVETRLKLLAKWFPQKYGDKQEIKHSGEVGLRGLLSEALSRE